MKPLITPTPKADTLYMLLYNWAGDWIASERFMYHAVDENDAREKAIDWAHYHGFDREAVDCRQATPQEAEKTDWLHDEWVS